jgi:hypothetical protein
LEAPPRHLARKAITGPTAIKLTAEIKNGENHDHSEHPRECGRFETLGDETQR